MKKKEVGAKIVIRPMAEEDIAEVVALDKSVLGEKRLLTYSNPLEDYLGGTVGLSWVAEVDDKVVGFILCDVATPRLGMPKVAWIGTFAVDPEHQHRGLGGELIKALVEYCRRQKIPEIHVSANRHDEAIESFLGFLGFRQGDLIHYVKTIET